MFKAHILTIILAAASGLAYSQELLLAARVDKISLLPRGSRECADPCPQTQTELPNGNVSICISTSCGCQVTTLIVDKVLLGETSTGPMQVKANLGEYCKPTYPISSQTLLIHLKDGATHLSVLDNVQGTARFDAKAFETIGKLSVASLKQTDGKVALDTLLGQLAKPD